MTPSLGIQASGHEDVILWTPASIPGIVEFWDFSDTSKISAPGNDVASVVGALGAYTLGHGTPAPKSGLTTLNGKNVIDFGAAGTVNLSVTITTIAQPVTYLVVYKGNAITGTQPIIDTTNRDLYDQALGSSSNKRIMFAGSSIVAGSTATTAAEQAVILLNGASSQLWVNGVSDATGNPGTNTTGSLFVVGGDSSGSISFNGSIAFIGLISGAISSGDRASWNAYCAKWGL